PPVRPVWKRARYRPLESATARQLNRRPKHHDPLRTQMLIGMGAHTTASGGIGVMARIYPYDYGRSAGTRYPTVNPATVMIAPATLIGAVIPARLRPQKTMVFSCRPVVISSPPPRPLEHIALAPR